MNSFRKVRWYFLLHCLSEHLCVCHWSSYENACSTSCLDSLLGDLGEELGLDDDGDRGHGTLAENLEKALCREWDIIIYRFGDIDNSGLVLGRGGSCLFWHERPELVEVHGWLELLVSLETEVSHTLLSEVPGMAIKQMKLAMRALRCRRWHGECTYHLFMLILMWCLPPARPLPPGCFLCLPTLPCPCETCPLNFLVFLSLATYGTKGIILNSRLPFLLNKNEWINKY